MMLVTELWYKLEAVNLVVNLISHGEHLEMKTFALKREVCENSTRVVVPL